MHVRGHTHTLIHTNIMPDQTAFEPGESPNIIYNNKLNKLNKSIIYILIFLITKRIQTGLLYAPLMHKRVNNETKIQENTLAPLSVQV